MTFSKEIRDDVAILTLKGKLMGGPDTEKLRKVTHELIEQGINKVVIDLARVKWMNSSGLGALMTVVTSLKNSDGVLKLANATERVESLLIITQLIKIFDTYESIDEAVAAF